MEWFLLLISAGHSVANAVLEATWAHGTNMNSECPCTNNHWPASPWATLHD